MGIIVYLSGDRLVVECQSLITLAASVGKHNITVWRLFVCPIGILTVTHQRAACDAASIDFGWTVSRTNIFVVIMLI